MLSPYLNSHKLNKKQLSKAASIKIQKEWMKLFATRVKEKTGKWKIEHAFWMGFAENIEPCFKNNKAIYEYEKQKLEMLYIFDESGKHCYMVSTSTWPKFYNAPEDIYVVPESFDWTIVFRHDNAIYFSYRQ